MEKNISMTSFILEKCSIIAALRSELLLMKYWGAHMTYLSQCTPTHLSTGNINLRGPGSPTTWGN